MDITPQVINEVAFHKARRGYDPAEVDDFLDSVASAFDELGQRVKELETQAEAADRRASKAEDDLRGLAEASVQPRAASDSDEPDPVTQADLDEKMANLQRTLVIAQQTADQAIKAAREEAARLKSEAEAEAEQFLADTHSEGQRLHEQAEIDARRHGEGTRQRLIEEVIALEEIRDGFKSDAALLERHVTEQRHRVSAAVSELRRALDEKLRATELPALSDAGAIGSAKGELGTGDTSAGNALPTGSYGELAPVSGGDAAAAGDAEPDESPASLDVADPDEPDEPGEARPAVANDSDAEPDPSLVVDGDVVDPPRWSLDTGVADVAGGSEQPDPRPAPPRQPSAGLRVPPGIPVPTPSTPKATSSDPTSARRAERAREDDAWSRFVADDDSATPGSSGKSAGPVDITDLAP